MKIDISILVKFVLRDYAIRGLATPYVSFQLRSQRFVNISPAVFPEKVRASSFSEENQQCGVEMKLAKFQIAGRHAVITGGASGDAQHKMSSMLFLKSSNQSSNEILFICLGYFKLLGKLG